MKEFADNLKRLRKERNLSQAQLSNISCIPVKTLQNYEQDRQGMSPTLSNLMILSDIFNVSPYDLYYGGSKEMSINSLYMSELFNELSQLSLDQIKKVHDSDMEGVSLPKLCLSDDFISDLCKKWRQLLPNSSRGIYKSYVELTVNRYAQNRQEWKSDFNLN